MASWFVSPNPGSRQSSFPTHHSRPWLWPQFASVAWAHVPSHELRFATHWKWCLQVRFSCLLSVLTVRYKGPWLKTACPSWTLQNPETYRFIVWSHRFVYSCSLLKFPGMTQVESGRPESKKSCWMKMMTCGLLCATNTSLRCPSKHFFFCTMAHGRLHAAHMIPNDLSSETLEMSEEAGQDKDLLEWASMPFS